MNRKGRYNQITMTHTKGFTLIELIIVIALIAILATTVILVINPVRLFQEARDSQRIADLGQMQSATSLYLATAATIDLDGAGVLSCATECWEFTGGDAAAGCGARHGTKTTTAVSSQAVDATGWVPVNLTGTSGGSPLAAWPRDPRNTATLYYSYACDSVNNTVEFDANMESIRYASGGTDDVEGTDGGNAGALFEVGTNVNL